MEQVNEKEVIKSLNNNEICILPTDTVYGIMAKLSKKNEERINLLKKRDKNQKISIIFACIEDILLNADNLDTDSIILIKDKLPGKYTFIVNLNKKIYQQYGFERSDYGVRVTANKTLQKIIKETGPLLATSCNYTKDEICTSYENIKSLFNDTKIKVFYTKKGNSKASTIIDLTNESKTIIRD